MGNSFRSAFELLETVGETPEDTFVEMKEDQSPFQHLQMQMELMQSQITKLETENQSLQSQLAEHRQENQSMLLKIDANDIKLVKVEGENQLMLTRINELDSLINPSGS